MGVWLVAGVVCVQPGRAGESELVMVVTLKRCALALLLLPECDGK